MKLVRRLVPAAEELAPDLSGWELVHHSAAHGALILDADLRIVRTNPAALDMLGLQHAPAGGAGAAFTGCLAPADRGAWVDACRAIAATGKGQHQAWIGTVAPGGERGTLLSSVSPLRWGHRPSLQCMLLDATAAAPGAPASGGSGIGYQGLTEIGIDMIWETDCEDRFSYVSFSNVVGTTLTRDLVIGRTRRELAHADADLSRWQLYEADQQARRPLRDLLYQLDPALTDGIETWLRVSGAPRFDASGAFLGYRGIATDVTGEVVAKRHAHDAEQRRKLALHSISEGFALFDAQGRLIECNETFRRIQGPRLAPLVRPGAVFEDLVRFQVDNRFFLPSQEDREAWTRRRIAGFRKGGEVFEVERADGGWHQARDHHCADGSIMVLCTDITELKAREQALVDSERRFRDYVDSAGDWFWETDQEHRFTYISPRFTEVTGVAVEHFIGAARHELAPEDAVSCSWQEHLADLEARRPFRDFIYAPNDCGEKTRHYRVSGVPVFNGDGEFRGYRGTAVECTADVEARALRERHLDAIESFSGGYALYDENDRLMEWNSAWAEFAHPATRATIRHGALFEEIVRSNVENGLFPDAAADPEAWIATRIRQHQACGEPVEIMGSHNRWFLLRERRTPEGGVLMTTTDVTELKRREEALRIGEERFRSFTETAADWFFETDAGLCLSFVSPRFEKLTGVDPESLIGEPFSRVIAQTTHDNPAARRCLARMNEREPLDELEVEGHTASGRQLIHSISAVAITDHSGTFTGYRGTGREVTQARQLANQLAYQATHDELTGLVNRRELEHRLARAIDSARTTNSAHALCFLDLDQFKLVNDTCGHSAGDELLRQLSQSLHAGVRGRDTLARLGGDEFALLLEHCSLSQAEAIAGSIRRAIESFDFTWEGKRFRLGASIGLVPIAGSLSSASEALRAADTACYLAKEQGRNRVHVYAPGDRDMARREGEMNWVTRINTALAEDRLVLYAQPIVVAGQARNVAAQRYELLLRLTEEDGSLVPPGAFLPAAERYGLASHIDRWVVRAALEFIERHRGSIAPDTHFSINLSGQSLSEPDFTTDLCRVLTEHELSAETICFEVTETAAIANLEQAREFMSTVRSLGCQFALDDFGTGLSSFAYLRELPVDYLKIDGAFTRDVDTDPVNLSMVRSINDIGHVLGKQTIAEYVSAEAQARLLTEIGVDFLQGFGIGKPFPLQRLVEPSASTAPAPEER